MATGGVRLNIFNKKLMGSTEFKDKFFDYMLDYVDDLGATVYGEGVFTAVTMAGTVNDKFDLIAMDGEDGLGKHISASGDSWPFENTNSQWYDVGFFYAEKPIEIETNSRDGLYYYREYEETVGDSGDPDSVTYPTPGLQFNLDTILGSDGADHAGLTATVWLKDQPASDVLGTAIESAVITAGNTLLITGTLGQSTSPSLVASDYTVLVEGVSWRAVSSAGDEKGTSGFCFIGSVQGSGSPSIPSTFDVTKQTVFDVVSAAAEVLYKDSHGFVKIGVKADSLDSDEPQITVWDYSNNEVQVITDTETRFEKVAKFEDTDGTSDDTPKLQFVPTGSGAYSTWEIYADDSISRFHLGRNDSDATASKLRITNSGSGGGIGLIVESDIEVGIGSGTSSSKAVFATSADNFELQHDSISGFLMNANSAGPVTIWITNGGAGTAHLNVLGTITSAAGSFSTTASTLTLDDTTTSSPINLSNTGQTGISTFNDSIVGGINDAHEIADETLGNSIVSGFAVSATGSSPPTITIASGVAIVNGKRVTNAGETVTLPVSNVGWVTIDETGDLDWEATEDTAYSEGVIVYWETDTTSVTLYQDARKFTAHGADDVLEYTVGDTGHFAGFEEAIQYLELLAATTIGTYAQRYRLRVVGQVTTYTGNSGIIIPDSLSGLEIIGYKDADHAIEWNGTGPLFKIKAAAVLVGLTIRDCYFDYTGTSPGVNCYVLDLNTTSPQFLTLSDNYLHEGRGGSMGLLYTASTTSITNLLMERNYSNGDLSLVDLGTGKVVTGWIQDNFVAKKSDGTGTESTTLNCIDLGSGSERVWVVDNWIQNEAAGAGGSFVDGIYATAGDHIKVIGNQITGTGSDPAPSGCGINLALCDNCDVSHNVLIDSSSGDVFTTGGILTGGEATVIGNYIDGCGSAASSSTRGIYCLSPDASSGFFKIIGNTVKNVTAQTGGEGIRVDTSTGTATDAVISDNIVEDVDTGAGIQVQNFQRVTISGNSVNDIGDGSTTTSCVEVGLSSDCVIDGNVLTTSQVSCDGINVGATDCVVSNNQIECNEGATPLAHGIEINAADVVVDGNHIQGGDHGIEMSSSAVRCVVTGNYIEDSDTGIRFNVTEALIVGNYCFSCSTYGIEGTSTGDYSLIDANFVKTAGTNGILIPANCDNCIVTSNMSNLSDSGTGTTTDNNVSPP